MMVVSSLCACARDTPGFSCTSACIQLEPRASRRLLPVICACIAIGTQAAVATPRKLPMNPGGATPITVIGVLLIVSSRPTIAGSPAKRRCQ